MAQSLEGKVVIVTGASSGIGAATARLLAGMGCRLMLAARSETQIWELAGELGDQAHAITTDMTRGSDVERMVEETVRQFGRVDVLLANAGIFITGSFEEGGLDALLNLVDVNVNGVLRCIYAALPHLKKQGGDIVVTSSISGFTDIHTEPVYSASKHAVQSLVHTLRRQFAVQGIRVGAVCPGMVANALWGITTREGVDELVADHAALRSEDVAEAIAFMLTRPAHVTIRDLVMLPQSQDL